MRLFVGLDVSLEKTAICVISEHGKIVREAQAASEPEALLSWIGEQNGSIAAIGLEAGPLSQWLHRGLSEEGLDIVLMETRQVKGALKAMPIKTDRRVAEGIARLLHLGWFRPVHCKSVSAQEVLSLLYLALLFCPRHLPWPRLVTGRCVASEPCGLTTSASEPAPSLFHRLE